MYIYIYIYENRQIIGRFHNTVFGKKKTDIMYICSYHRTGEARLRQVTNPKHN